MSPELELKKQIRLLRGSPLTLFFTLIIVGGFASKSKLSAITGYSLPTIRTSMAGLAEYGWATEVSGGWQLTKHGLQISMNLGERLAGNEVKKFFSPTTTTESLINLKQQDIEAEAGKKFSPADQERFEALRDAGIGETVRSTLARDEGLTPEFIRGHAAKAKSEGMGTGMLVHRLREKDDLEDIWIHGECQLCSHSKNSHAFWCTVDDPEEEE